MEVTKELFEQAKGLEVKSKYPFLDPKVLKSTNHILRVKNVMDQLKGKLLPVYDQATLGESGLPKALIGFAKVNDDLTVTLRVVDKNVKEILKDCEGENFDDLFKLSFFGRARVDVENQPIFEVEYLFLASPIPLGVGTELKSSLMQILGSHLNRLFPKGKGHGREKALELVSVAFNEIVQVLKGRFPNDVFIATFCRESLEDKNMEK